MNLPTRCCQCNVEHIQTVVLVKGIPIVGACTASHLAAFMRATTHLGTLRLITTINEAAGHIAAQEDSDGPPT